jgi:hypothetical protein
MSLSLDLSYFQQMYRVYPLLTVHFISVSGSIMFHVRRRPADYHPRKRKKKLQQKWNQGSSNELMEYRYEEGFDRLPFFLELNPGELMVFI